MRVSNKEVHKKLMAKYRLKSGLYIQRDPKSGKRITHHPGAVVEGDFEGNNKFELVVAVETEKPKKEEKKEVK